MASSFKRFLDHTRHTTVGRTPLDEWSARRRDLCLTIHNTYNKQTPMTLVRFKPIISAGERPQTYALDRAATGTGYGIMFIHSLVFSLEGWAWQEPEPCHVTGMALAHCILGKFLGIVYHCFPPPLDVPTLAVRCLRPQRRERS